MALTIAHARRAATRVLLILFAGCTLSPRDGQILESRSDRFEAVIAYLADHPAFAEASLVDRDLASVILQAVRPGRAPTPGGCVLELGCRSDELIRQIFVFLRRGTGQTPLIQEALQPNQSLSAAQRQLFPGFSGGVSGVALRTDVTGRDLVVVNVEDVQIAESLWSPCAGATVACPPGTQFFARFQTVIAYGGSPMMPWRIDGRPLPRPPTAALAVGAPFAAGDATDRCIMEQFPTGGAVAVQENCRVPDRNFTLVFARR